MHSHSHEAGNFQDHVKALNDCFDTSDEFGVFYKTQVNDEFMHSMLAKIDSIAFCSTIQRDYSFSNELYDNLKHTHLTKLQIMYV